MVNVFRWVIYISRGKDRSSLKVPGEEYMFAYKLHLPCFNNEAEYEFVLVGLKVARRLGIKRLKVFGDSELVIR